VNGAAVLPFPVRADRTAGFLQNLRDREYSGRTVEVYSLALTKLGAFLGSDVADASAAQIAAWAHAMHEAGLSPASRSLYLTAAREFFSWACAAGLIEADPIGNRKDLTIRRKEVESTRHWKGIAPADLEKIRAAAQDAVRTASGPEKMAQAIRDRAVVAVLLETGLRASEVADLTMESIVEIEGRTILSATGKGGKQRMVPVGGEALEALREWIAVRPEEPGLFGFDDRRGVTRTVSRIAAAAGVVGIHPHQFRHSCAMRLLETSRDVELVATLLGHSSTATTRLYLDHSPAALMRRLEAAGI
jgi:site-specific recombinase XerD